MTTRRRWHIATLAAAALIVAGCGGGSTDSPLVSRLVSFGDSYSDLGTYAPATSINGPGTGAPFFAGRFTTNTHTGYTAASNSNTATIWVEWVAARLGVVITQAAIGFATTNIPCPAAANPSLASSCTAYGQGGALVTDPNGIGKSGGALTVPLATQVANHLARFTSFDSDDIVFVWSNNHLLTNFGAYSQGLPEATAIANIETAATELAALVKDQIVAKGATRVAVMLLPDIASMPAYNQLPPQANTGLLAQLATAFNATITAALAGVDVRYIDMQTLFIDVRANPSKYGLTNITAAACDPAKIAAVTGGRITDGSALFCNAAAGQPFNTMKAGANASTWLYADGVHPTTGGHKVIADYVFGKIKDFGWVPGNL
jgi:outer membrane lipase/esterase